MKALAAALVFLVLQVQAVAATLTVHVTDIDKKGGIFRLSLYDQSGWSKDEDTPIASANVPAV